MSSFGCAVGWLLNLARPVLRTRLFAVTLAASLAFAASGGFALQGGPASAASGHVHLTARDEPVREVLVRLGEMAHLNLAIGNEVSGTVSVSLTDVTAEDALHAVCSQAHLRCVRDGRTVIVSQQTSAVFPLQLTTSVRAKNVVRGLFPRLAVSEGSGNTLIVTGSDNDVQAARAVVQGLDVRDPTQPPTEALSLRTQSAS